MRMQVILDSSFARPGSFPIWGGKKVEFRDWTTPSPECRAFKLLYETSAVSLFTRLPTPTLLAARGIAALKSRSQSRLHVYLFCVLSHGFSRKRETARSLHKIKNISTNNEAMLLKLGRDVAPYEIYQMVYILMLLWKHARFQSPTFSILNITTCDSTRQNTWSYLGRMPVPPSLGHVFNIFSCILFPVQL